MKQYARENTASNLSLVEFAVSRRKNAQYIGRLFKKETGKSFSEYCNRLRLKKASTYLLSTDEKIIDVAMAYGFQNVSYFNKLFLESYGLSPSKYRKQKA